MNLSIECLPASAPAPCQVREQLFGREWRVILPDLSEYATDRQLTLVARDKSNQQPIAALSVVETTSDVKTHGHLELSFFKDERAARYTQLAVLKPYRGLNLPVRLILGAQRRFVEPRQIHYTWLLFGAERARTSSLCTLLGLGASSRSFLTEYGCSRVLMRDETATLARSCDCHAQSWLEAAEHVGLAKSVGAGVLEARW
jgi:hypothetical protein